MKPRRMNAPPNGLPLQQPPYDKAEKYRSVTLRARSEESRAAGTYSLAMLASLCERRMCGTRSGQLSVASCWKPK